MRSLSPRTRALPLPLAPLLLAAAALLWGGPARATTIALSQMSSDSTPASSLTATVEFEITGASELTVTLSNASDFDVNELYFNASSVVTGLTLDSATHSAEGDVLSGWSLSTGVMADGFGTFDFGLIDGVGIDPDKAGPGEGIVFVLTIAGAGPFTMDDFVELSSPPPPDKLALVAAKFVSGPGDDSAYGATAEVPEPTLLGLGAVGLGAGVLARRRRRPQPGR